MRFWGGGGHHSEQEGRDGHGGLVAQSSPAAAGGRDWGLELTSWFNPGQLTHKSELVNNPRHLGGCPIVRTR